ncbi:hypothetical protein IMZ48_09425 [Candidatus Bathyarchaeota archaeon]|nr:hypothetical protein [Candidatus Bathyarchaeota archaeon]
METKQVGRVSPRNSSRGGSGGNGDSHGRLSNSSAQSSPRLAEGGASDVSGDAERELGGNSGSGSHGDDTNPGSATTGSPTQPGLSFPPPSQPLLKLEGGGAIGMTSIREE